MQQLTAEALKQQASRQDELILLAFPLPDTPARATQFANRLGALLDAVPQPPEWGADRMQVIYSAGELRFLLCIEWLCDAMWLEPAGGVASNTDTLWQHINSK